METGIERSLPHAAGSANRLFESSAWMFLDGLVAELMSRTGEDENNMKERHIPTLNLHVYSNNTGALRLYRKFDVRLYLQS